MDTQNENPRVAALGFSYGSVLYTIDWKKEIGNQMVNLYWESIILMTWRTKYVILYGYKNRDLHRGTFKVKEVDV